MCWICMVSKSPKDRVIPLPNSLNGLQPGGYWPLTNGYDPPSGWVVGSRVHWGDFLVCFGGVRSFVAKILEDVWSENRWRGCLRLEIYFNMFKNSQKISDVRLVLGITPTQTTKKKPSTKTVRFPLKEISPPPFVHLFQINHLQGSRLENVHLQLKHHAACYQPLSLGVGMPTWQLFFVFCFPVYHPLKRTAKVYLETWWFWNWLSFWVARSSFQR